MRIVGIALIAALALPAAAPANLRDRIKAWREARQQPAATPAPANAPSGAQRTLTFGGVPRTYLIHVPQGQGPFPLVVLLHGGTQDGSKVWAQTSLPSLAASRRFILVAPDGVNGQWNDGRTTTMSGRSSDADDVGFLKALIAETVTRDRADSRAVFMTGGSNGGLMTMRYACEAGETLRAAANVIATLPAVLAASCKPAKALPWAMVAGTADPLMPFAGQRDGALALGRPQPAMLSANGTFDFWARNATCGKAERRQRLPDRDRTDGSTVERITRSSCTGNTTSSFYVMNGAGHSWPGVNTGRLARILGKANNDIDAGAVIWDHFAQTLRP